MRITWLVPGGSEAIVVGWEETTGCLGVWQDEWWTSRYASMAGWKDEPGWHGHW